MGELIRSNKYQVNESRHVVISLFGNQWGLIIPEPTGVFYDLQTGGVCCHHPQIEGIFLPLPIPIRIKKCKKSKENPYGSIARKLVDEMVVLNRDYKYEEADKIWDEIREELKMDWTSPDSFGFCEEGYCKIKLTKVNTDEPYFIDLRSLIGEEVYLVYPNSD